MNLRPLLCLPLALMLVGCPSSTFTLPPTAVAPGYVDTYDQQIGAAIQAATAFYVTIQNDVNAGKYKPTSGELTGLNTFGQALNATKVLAQTYHNNPTPANLAPTQNAVNGLQSQQTALQAQIGGK